MSDKKYTIYASKGKNIYGVMYADTIREARMYAYKMVYEERMKYNRILTGEIIEFRYGLGEVLEEVHFKGGKMFCYSKRNLKGKFTETRIIDSAGNHIG